MNRLNRRRAPAARRGRPDGPGVARTLLSAIAMPFAGTADVSELAISFAHAARALGFAHHVVSRITRSPAAASRESHIEIICGHYPDGWAQHYLQHHYAQIDPVHRAAQSFTTPYRWRSIMSLTAREQRLLDEASEAGLPDGISIPIHQPAGGILLVNLAAPTAVVSRMARQRLAYLLGTQFHFEFQRLAQLGNDAAPGHLTPRQCECLTWVARGKSSWAIAQLLGLSSHTVEYHITGAMKALGVNSRTAAAVQAAVLGLIRL
ncbi:LuxR family transcriptional regulator [Paraburkholderia phosphatilytica]|uniref:LuxR family transcriptional regulator n=1 Tax=Paraburkholderia phosphatilytica TaxID=2282883 RepID=UPI00197E5DC6|nr:LuxR family transcriptional regulator [Paraburkholderia phosphatilytica]